MIDIDSTKLVSVIVPIYNSAKYLGRCLDSLKKQTHKNLEVLLIDDGSYDNSFQICQKYAVEDKRFKAYRQSNKGVSATRNFGLDQASGDYLIFCDSDDWVEEDFVQHLLFLIQKYEADVSIVSIIIDDGKRTSILKKDDHVFEFDSKQAIIEMHKAILFEGHLCNKCFKKELFQSVRLNTDICILEDTLVLWPIFLKTQKVVFQNYQAYHYFINPNSALTRNYSEKDWDRRKSCLLMRKIAESEFPECIPFVNKTLIAQDLRIVEKLVISGFMNNDYKSLLVDEIRELCNSEIISYMSKDKRNEIHLLLKNYGKFTSMIKWNNLISSIKKRMKRIFL